jgi:hypothetical protein
MLISRYNVIYVQQEVVKRKGNRLYGTIGSVEKLVIMRELVKRL